MGNTKTVGFDIDEETHEKLREVAYMQKRTKSDIFRQALKAYLAQQAEPF